MHNYWFDTRVMSGEVVQFIIVERLEEKAIGSVYLRDINYEKSEAEYGIFIGEEDYLGKGYGSEVAELMCEYAFTVLDLNKVFLRVFAENTRAIKSYQNAKFEIEGCFKDDVKIGNSYHDIIFMARRRRK